MMQVQQHRHHKPKFKPHDDYLNVFRVSASALKKPSGTTVAPAAHPVFRPRTTHRKSRTGCKNCKNRRVKCDENRDDGCIKCRRHGLECDYLNIRRSSGRKKLIELREKPDNTVKPAAGSPKGLTNPVSVSIWEQFNSPLSMSLSFHPDLPIPTHFAGNMTSPLVALHHFNTLTSYTVGSPQGQNIIQTCILGVAMQTPHLMHALLGVAAAHMTYLLPADVNAVQHTRNKLADAYHWSHALKLFREELAGKGARSENMDGLLSTIMLLAIHQFALKDDPKQGFCDADLPSESWRRSFVLVEDQEAREEAVKWLSIQAGFKLLLAELGKYLEQSVWLPVLQDASIEKERGLEQTKWSGAGPNSYIGTRDDVEEAFCSICGIKGDSNENNNAYFGSLETLLSVRKMRPISVKSFNKMITFLGRVTAEFKALLIARDAAALLILAHWLSMMAGGIKQWWIVDRAETECKAIVFFLKRSKVDQQDQRLRTLLREPAEVVGIEI